ncbi:kinase-like domain-containing protein [Syncephalis plumigaleata]|nr:kinase-like domain-containing protein [Syncephalis plumigaleata]
MRRHIEIAHGQHYCFVLTYGSEQNLVQYLSEIPSWRKYEVLPNIFFQVVRATAYLHRASVVHNEIKPENILVNSVNPVNPKILLIDYDSADFLVLASPTTPPRASYCVGSPSYYPPECVEGKLHNPFRLSTWMSGERAKSFNPIGKDAWAIGATFYEVLFSKRTLNVKNLIEFSVSPRLFFRYLAIAKNFTRNRNSRQRMQQLIDEVAKFLAYKETDRPVPQKYLEANINNPLFI